MDGHRRLGRYKREEAQVIRCTEVQSSREQYCPPFWEWLAERIVGSLQAEGVENPTMASLFDGIGGFPLVFQRQGCNPVWASEIEEFPIAVTKTHFPEEEEKEG